MLVRDEVERRGRAAQFRQRPGKVAVQNGRREQIDGGNCVADGGRVGGVGFEKQIRFFAAQQLAREVYGNFHGELHLALREQLLDFRLAFCLAGDVEVAAVAQAPDNRAREDAVVGGINRRRQMLGVGIDGVAEQDELRQRDADHHAERQPVAPHLDEFLHHDRPKPPPVKCKAFHEKSSFAVGEWEHARPRAFWRTPRLPVGRRQATDDLFWLCAPRRFDARRVQLRPRRARSPKQFEVFTRNYPSRFPSG